MKTRMVENPDQIDIDRLSPDERPQAPLGLALSGRRQVSDLSQEELEQIAGGEVRNNGAFLGI